MNFSLYIKPTLLFACAFLGGIIPFYISKNKNTLKSFALTFVGSYLFAITLIHILPEIYEKRHKFTGILVVIGVFIQILLEYFSGGAEHGHVYIPNTNDANTKKGVSSSSTKHIMALFIPLCLHAILDSVMLLEPCCNHAHHMAKSSSTVMLFGIILHKIPASFALSTLIYSVCACKTRTIKYLFIFSAISPLGLLFGNGILQYLPQESLFMLKSIAGGSFIYIAATIFFESMPTHFFELKKLLAITVGLLLAIVTELYTV